MKVRSVAKGDAEAWERMRQAFWPSKPGEHAAEIEAFFERREGPAAVLVALNDAGQPIGFAELSIRPNAEGCGSNRVAYLEGWYVELAARGKGVGRALVRAAEEWALAQGLREFASDTGLNDEASVAAHQAVGFKEVARIRCFRKEL